MKTEEGWAAQEGHIRLCQGKEAWGAGGRGGVGRGSGGVPSRRELSSAITGKCAEKLLFSIYIKKAESYT